MTSGLPEEIRLGLDWELWLVEELLFGATREGLVQTLVQEGLSEAQARAQLGRIEGSAGFRRIAERTAEARLAARLQRLQRETAVDVVPRHPTLDADSLLRHHWIPGLPAVLTDAFPDLRARSWTPQGLAARFGDVPVSVNVRREEAATPADTEQWFVRRPLAELLARVVGPPGNDAYAVSRSGLLAEPGLRALWEDLRPLPSFLVPTEPPVGASLWVGPAGTVTPAHFDPHNTVLLQVHGRKRIRLAPRLRAALHGLFDGWTLNGSMDDAFGERVQCVELGPGEALFVPAAWVHEVTALEPSLTLSFLAFPWPNHFHWLGPPGSGDG